MSYSSRRVRPRSLAKLAIALTAACAPGALSVAPALASGPASVQVRVEGLNNTLVPLTTVTTNATPVSGDGGAHSCSGYTAAGALTQATGPGNWSGTWYSSFSDFIVTTIDGETYPPPSGSPSAAYTGFYWSYWYDHAPAQSGVCGTAVNSGDDILFFPDCSTYGGTQCPPGWVSPNVLGLAAPAIVQRGQPFTTTVTSYDNASGAASPATNATVGGGGASASTNAQGQATLTLGSVGTFGLRATAPSSVRSETRLVCVHDGNDGNCGFPGPTQPGTPGAAGPSLPPPPPCKPGMPGCLTPPALLVGHILGLLDRGHYRAGSIRVLRGSVLADAAGIRAVRLRLERRLHGRCVGYDGRRERFAPIRCGAGHARFFSVGAKPQFSYLLPSGLARGRYVLDLEPVDGAGRADLPLQRGRNRVVFYVI